MAEALSPDRLTEWTSCGGCAAKWGATALTGMVADLPPSTDEALVVGLAPFDDAAVYRLTDELALVSTTDFFPPLVDDPDDFGTIAAANAISDVFAMGARVVTAVSIAAFPEDLAQEAMRTILHAAARTVADAGGSLAGGHTIRNPEPVFGLAVQGVVHPDRVWTKSGARADDVIMLSKPLGAGIAQAGRADDAAMAAAAVAGMRTLNRQAAEQLTGATDRRGDVVHAVTDVTGYGLGGHGWEMAERSGVRLVLDAAALPAYPGVLEAIERGVSTGGAARNAEYAGPHLVVADTAAGARARALALDPQTSGGLLAAVDPAVADDLADQGWTRLGVAVAGEPAVELR